MQTDARIKLLRDDVAMPTRATDGSAALDVHATFGADLPPGETLMMPLGFAMELEPNYCALLLPRSGLGGKRGLVLANTLGLIDSDYRDEVAAMLFNRNDPSGWRCAQLAELLGREFRCHGESGLAARFDDALAHWRAHGMQSPDDTIRIEPGQRIAQLLILPVARATLHVVDALSDTGRTGGLGSTGL